jgi:hypothetical protein
MKMAVFWVVAPCSLVEVYQVYNPEDSHQLVMSFGLQRVKI